MIHPKGYQILTRPVRLEEKTAGGIVLPEQVHKNEDLLGQVAEVISMGDQAYRDPKRFDEPWCRIGDYVVYDKYSGIPLYTRDDIQYRLIDDDMVRAVVDSPEDLRRNTL